MSPSSAPGPAGATRPGASYHEKIKSLRNSLRTILEHERVRFLGGVEVGAGGVPAARLRELYHAVVYCVGAATDRHLGIPGEDLPGSWAATEFVSLLEDAPALVDGELREDPLDALRAAGLAPVGWAGWCAIEQAEAELGASLGRRVVKLPDWQSLMNAARAR